MVKLLIWATHLQTDILAVALHLDTLDDIELMVVTLHRETYLRQTIARVRPFRAPLLDRDHPQTARKVAAFGADVVIIDNNVPPKGTAPRLLYMWHGLGWKAPSKLDILSVKFLIRQLTGAEVGEPNPNFRAQCYGELDRRFRITKEGYRAESCTVLGMAFSDLLLDPPYGKEAVAGTYAVDVINRKSVLLCISWHYTSVFPTDRSDEQQSGVVLRRSFGGEPRVEDLAFVERMIGEVGALGANLILCLHERYRYSGKFLKGLVALARGKPHVEIRHKDDYPDNLSDLLVADVMVSNLSSFITYFYVLGRPAIHIAPVKTSTESPERMNMLLKRMPYATRTPSSDAWVNDPFDTGGPQVSTPGEAVAAVRAALADPLLGLDRSRDWLARHVHKPDGSTCARVEALARGMAAGTA